MVLVVRNGRKWKLDRLNKAMLGDYGSRGMEFEVMFRKPHVQLESGQIGKRNQRVDVVWDKFWHNSWATCWSAG